jgi:hypothetical protein
MKPRAKPLLSLAAAVLLGIGGMLPVWAGDGHDHDRARQALENGEILPLRTILEQVERDVPGQIMEVELDRHDERWIYEIKVLRRGGALVKLKLDARDGAWFESKGFEGKGVEGKGLGGKRFEGKAHDNKEARRSGEHP